MTESFTKRILVVDDDPLITQSLRNILEIEGYAITIAGDGRTAIDAFLLVMQSNEPFVLVITDLGMHGMDGRQVISVIKKSSPATPVILLTGWGKWFEDRNNPPLQVNCILAKPPKLAELRQDGKGIFR
jgi:DNA-binding response OmpR family regulator